MEVFVIIMFIICGIMSIITFLTGDSLGATVMAILAANNFTFGYIISRKIW